MVDEIRDDVDILLEVSERLSDPLMFHRGAFANENQTRFCAFGHLRMVCFNTPYLANIYTHGTQYERIADLLEEKALEKGNWGLPGINDQLGREAAKSVVDEVIYDLKDGK